MSKESKFGVVVGGGVKPGGNRKISEARGVRDAEDKPPGCGGLVGISKIDESRPPGGVELMNT
jgi:hypothetical protein